MSLSVVASLLMVNAVPPWQLAQLLANTVLPAVAEAVRLPSELRFGFCAKVFNEPT